MCRSAASLGSVTEELYAWIAATRTGYPAGSALPLEAGAKKGGGSTWSGLAGLLSFGPCHGNPIGLDGLDLDVVSLKP